MKKLVMLLALAVLALVTRGRSDELPRKPVLTLDAAKQVVAAAVGKAEALGVAINVAVVDDGGNLLLLERMDGAVPASANVAWGKARTSARFRKVTADLENTINKGRVTMTALPDFTPLQGGVPIAHDGQVIGAVGVSGVNPVQDEEIAKTGAAALTPPQPSE